ncbi:hypothetical protein LWI28_017064 [Acer negundo]|uniref:Pentatricopeptide repeat-containing protein n=1 Tax=Acer negundo TaxID=4023 RepID=A0AAD5IEI4_ACENE|nr:hypothetical protein LWI28_017064 [Acer negundo]
MIKGFAENSQSFRAITLYKNMLDTYFPPNNYTFLFLLKAYANLSDLFIGLQCHGQVIKYDDFNCERDSGWEFIEEVNMASRARNLPLTIEVDEESSKDRPLAPSAANLHSVDDLI